MLTARIIVEVEIFWGILTPFEVGSRIIVMSLLKVLVFSRSLKDRGKQYGRKTKIM
jgi:hypothetical protein